MNIAVISFVDYDVSKGVKLLVEKYKDKNPKILLPILKRDTVFSQSVLKIAIENQIKVTCFFESAVGHDHLLKQADDICLTEDPIKEITMHLKSNDVLAMVWDDTPQSFHLLHMVEDLALETFDLFDGLDPIESEPEFSLDNEKLHAELMMTMGRAVDLMCAFIANTVMASMSEAVAEHIINAEDDSDKKDIDPFNNLE